MARRFDLTLTPRMRTSMTATGGFTERYLMGLYSNGLFFEPAAPGRSARWERAVQRGCGDVDDDRRPCSAG
jgi:hypothetical protein